MVKIIKFDKYTKNIKRKSTIEIEIDNNNMLSICGKMQGVSGNV